MIRACRNIYRILMSFLFLYIWYRSMHSSEDGLYEYEETADDGGVINV